MESFPPTLVANIQMNYIQLFSSIDLKMRSWYFEAPKGSYVCYRSILKQ